MTTLTSRGHVVTDASDSPTAYLTISGISKHYPTGGGVSEVDLSITRGQMLVLLGPSGCGKTTLLRTLAGLLRPDEGSIRLDGRDIVDTPTHRRNISMVFQTWALFPTMSVRENVAFGLRMRRTSREERTRRVDDALALVGLSEFAERMPGSLSGGQQQRVAVARAIVTEPRLILMDEPLSSLDHRVRVQVRGQLKQLQRELGLTGVYVTHDHTEALVLGDQVAVMDNGRVLEVGSPVEVFARPTRRYTAEFLGLGNVIDVRTGTRPGEVVTTGGHPLKGMVGAGGAPVVAVALRADCVVLEPDLGGPGSLDGVVRNVEYQPGGVLHEVEVVGGQLLQAVTPVGSGYLPGTPVAVRPDWEKAVPLID